MGEFGAVGSNKLRDEIKRDLRRRLVLMRDGPSIWTGLDKLDGHVGRVRPLRRFGPNYNRQLFSLFII